MAKLHRTQRRNAQVNMTVAMTHSNIGFTVFQMYSITEASQTKERKQTNKEKTKEQGGEICNPKVACVHRIYLYLYRYLYRYRYLYLDINFFQKKIQPDSRKDIKMNMC